MQSWAPVSCLAGHSIGGKQSGRPQHRRQAVWQAQHRWHGASYMAGLDIGGTRKLSGRPWHRWHRQVGVATQQPWNPPLLQNASYP